MRGYGQFCPVAKASEIFAERWTPLIMRELLIGSHRFSELRHGLPIMSQSLLSQRLRVLEQAGVVERRPAPDGHGMEYHLTPAGQEVGQIVEALGAWGYRWALAELRQEDLDPETLMWWIHRHIHVDRLPQRRIVVRFEFADGRRKLWWLILNRPEVDLCLRDEGFDVDLVVKTNLLALTQVYLGHLPIAQAMRDETVLVDGPRDLKRAFPQWIGVSHFARYGVPTPAASAASSQ
jgi:DNA-binding HxlR family transcriptional regulator